MEIVELNCEIKSTLYISSSDLTVENILKEYKYGFREFHLHYDSEFDIKSIVHKFRDNNINMDKLLPNSISFRIKNGCINIINENGNGVIEVIPDFSKIIHNPMKISKQLIESLWNKQISEEDIIEKIGMK